MVANPYTCKATEHTYVLECKTTEDEGWDAIRDQLTESGLKNDLEMLEKNLLYSYH